MKKSLPILILLFLAFIAFVFSAGRDSFTRRFSIKEIPPGSGYPAIAIITDNLYHRDYPFRDITATIPDGRNAHLSIGFAVAPYVRACVPGEVVPIASMQADADASKYLMPDLTEKKP